MTSDLLNFITRNWEAALIVAEEVRSLNTQYITEASITSDEVMTTNAILLVKHLRTKLEVAFEVQARGSDGDNGMEGLDVAVRSKVKVIYGEGLKEEKMAAWMDERLKAQESWVGAVGKLDEKLKGRGKK